MCVHIKDERGSGKGGGQGVDWPIRVLEIRTDACAIRRTQKKKMHMWWIFALLHYLHPTTERGYMIPMHCNDQ
jgi:hypothetical protein